MTIKEAKNLYFQYDGSLFLMSRDGVDEAYEQAGIPRKVEAAWLAELKRERLGRLGEPGNWWVVYFFLHHSDLGHLADFIAAEPRGVLWQRCSYLEKLVDYADRVRTAGGDPALVARAADCAVAGAGQLLRRARSEAWTRRVRDLIRSAEDLRREAGGV